MPEPEPQTLPEAERALNQARADLDTAFGSLTEPAQSSAPAPSGGEAKKAETRSERASPEASSSCASACRALGSLRRAAAAVCRLAGPEERPRCTRAQDMLSDAERRVTSCGCR